LIKGIHGLLYTPKPDELREFIRDKLGIPFTDTGEGWLIFDLPEADLGVHPSKRASHSISFYCDDISKTVEVLKSRGVEFTSGITDQGWGMLTHFRMPGGADMELFEPKYEKKRARRITESAADGEKEGKEENRSGEQDEARLQRTIRT
jgi:predicted enzyme related to lactoylglutathione lyase